MAAQNLIQFIESHSFNAVELEGGKILAEEQFSAEEAVLASHGNYGPYWTVIEPTLGAVRDWLGY